MVPTPSEVVRMKWGMKWVSGRRFWHGPDRGGHPGHMLWDLFEGLLDASQRPAKVWGEGKRGTEVTKSQLLSLPKHW